MVVVSEDYQFVVWLQDYLLKWAEQRWCGQSGENSDAASSQGQIRDAAGSQGQFHVE